MNGGYNFRCAGDLAYYDESGRVYFVDRLDDVIECLETRVFPLEIEDLILKHHEGVAEVAVTGLPHKKYGQAPAAFVVLKTSHKAPGKINEEDIEETVASMLARLSFRICAFSICQSSY